MATLFIASGPNEGRWYPVGHKTTVIGRDDGLIVQVVGEGISRKHLRIFFDEAAKSFMAEDMGSKNGSFVNGQKIVGVVKLFNDDLLRIGDTLLLFTLEEAKDEKENALLYARRRGERDKVTLKDQKVPKDLLDR